MPARDLASKWPLSKAATAYLFLAIVMLAWAGNSIVARGVRDAIPPFTLAFVRWSGALALMLPFALPRLARDRDLLRAHWRIVLLLGLLGVASFNAFLYLGLHYTSASNGILIQAAIPPLILIANLVIFREAARPLQVAGTILSTAGVVLVVARGDLGVLFGLKFSRGDVFVLCGVVGWALYTALLRLRSALDPISFLAATFVVGALAMLPLAIGEWGTGHHIVWAWPTIGAFAYVAIFPSLIGYLLYNTAVGMIGAGRAGQTVTLMPLFGAFLAAALLGEPLAGYHYAGMALILAGIALSIVPLRRRTRESLLPPDLPGREKAWLALYGLSSRRDGRRSRRRR